MFADIPSPAEQRARYAEIKAKFARKPERKQEATVPAPPPEIPANVNPIIHDLPRPVAIPANLAKALAVPAVPGAVEGPVDADVPPAEPKVFRLTIRAVITIVARETGVTVEALRGPRRHKDITTARQIAMWLCADLVVNVSLVSIGRYLNRDHTTALHGANKIAAEVEAKTPLGIQAAAIRGIIRGTYGLEGEA